MRQYRTPKFRRSFKRFPRDVQAALEKQIRFLVVNIRHPSLRAKKYDETRGIWQARVTRNVRFYFGIDGDYYILLDIEKHSD